MSEHPMHDLVSEIERDLAAAAWKLGELKRQIGELPLDRRRRGYLNGPVTADACSSCGVGNGHAADCPHATLATATA